MGIKGADAVSDVMSQQSDCPGFSQKSTSVIMFLNIDILYMCVFAPKPIIIIECTNGIWLKMGYHFLN